MTIFDVLALLGGLCLFLFGMNVMGDSLERRAGGGLKLPLWFEPSRGSQKNEGYAKRASHFLLFSF